MSIDIPISCKRMNLMGIFGAKPPPALDSAINEAFVDVDLNDKKRSRHAGHLSKSSAAIHAAVSEAQLVAVACDGYYSDIIVVTDQEVILVGEGKRVLRRFKYDEIAEVRATAGELFSLVHVETFAGLNYPISSILRFERRIQVKVSNPRIARAVMEAIEARIPSPLH